LQTGLCYNLPKQESGVTGNKTETAFWRADDLGAELLRGRFSDFSYELHTHETACFALLTGGAIRIRMRGGEFTARRGDIYAIAADEPHAGWPVDGAGWKLRTVYVDLAHLRRLAGDRSTGSVSLGGPIIRDAELFWTLYGVHRCSESQGSALLREQRYLAFAARLFARHTRAAAAPADAGQEPRAVGLARDFLDQCLGDQVRLAEIASAAGLPAYQLYRAFNRSTGMTPHGYQRQARVRLAQRLIRGGESLGEVAAASGFADQAHMTRSFRRATGMTPGVYRQALLKRA
jgi:AraC-like DNA-binding protein